MTLLEEALREPQACEVESDHFRAWWNYWGELDRVEDECGVTRLYGFENVSDPDRLLGIVRNHGACYGFVADGEALIEDDGGVQQLVAGEWFTTPAGCHVDLGLESRVIVSQRESFRGMRAFGGPVEEIGRLRYIDGCSDTLLACPPVKGDPCLNYLHFPGSIAQTEHYHPSVRSGTVARGAGWCETPKGLSPLVPGMAFSIPARGLHRFLTEARVLDVIAYHPDSDWGPTDDDHPMLNRTWISEGKALQHDRESQVADRWACAVEVG